MLYNNMHEDITTPNLGVFTAATSGIADSRVSSPGAGILALVVGLSGVGVDPAVALGRVRAGEVGHQGRVGQCDAALWVRHKAVHRACWEAQLHCYLRHVLANQSGTVGSRSPNGYPPVLVRPPHA